MVPLGVRLQFGTPRPTIAIPRRRNNRLYIDTAVSQTDPDISSQHRRVCRWASFWQPKPSSTQTATFRGNQPPLLSARDLRALQGRQLTGRSCVAVLGMVCQSPAV
jgi:hypothetical protein